jgi:hypothetical protein
MHENPTPIRSMAELNSRQRYQLLADLLDFFATDPDQPVARTIRELARDARFADYSRWLLTDVTRSLVVVGLLIRPPHFRTRASAYLTTREGLKVLQDYRERLDRL